VLHVLWWGINPHCLTSSALLVCHIIVHILLLSIHHCHSHIYCCCFFSIMLLMLLSLCYMCHGEVLCPPITLCKGWSSIAIKNKEKKEVNISIFFCFHFFNIFYFKKFLKRFFFGCLITFFLFFSCRNFQKTWTLTKIYSYFISICLPK
jgi:hypothetical protein